MMDVFEAIHSRRSVRKFKPDTVPPELIHRILDAGRWAPSAGNLQSWEFIVVKDEKVKAKLAESALGQNLIAQAPVVIAVCADTQRSSMKYGERGKVLYSIQDTAAAVMNLTLAAHALGLGSCWVGAFFDERVTDVLKLPPGVVPVALVPIGYAAEKPVAPARSDLNDVVHFDRYGNKQVMEVGKPSEAAPKKKKKPGLMDILR